MSILNQESNFDPSMADNLYSFDYERRFVLPEEPQEPFELIGKHWTAFPVKFITNFDKSINAVDVSLIVLDHFIGNALIHKDQPEIIFEFKNVNHTQGKIKVIADYDEQNVKYDINIGMPTDDPLKFQNDHYAGTLFHW